MRYIKNSDIKNIILTVSAVAFISSAGCFVLNIWAGIVSVIAYLLIISALILAFTKRQKRIESISSGIDDILFGKENFDLKEYHEGEINILANNINKLLIKLREQTDLLKKEKVHLADSIADISHQIRTPLTSVNLILQSLMYDETLTKEEITEKLFEIRKLTTHIDSLVSSLLKMARFDAGEIKFYKEELPLQVLIEKSLSSLTVPMEIKMQKAEIACEGMFWGDINWTVEALTNIMKNCTEHMDSGTLYITAQENPIYTEITIRDTGCGFDKDDLPHIFERFYRGKNSSQSSIGIGLALSRLIIVSQGGTIKAENHREKGALFTIRFYKE